MTHSATPAAPAALPPRFEPGKRALVVGASTGIGAALVEQLVREGYAVAALARRADKLAELELCCEAFEDERGGRLIVRVHDVEQRQEVPALFEELVQQLGGLDLFVFAAGIMPAMGRHEYDTEKDVQILTVNTLGLIAWANPVARLLRSQRHGTIVGISSIAGDRGRKGHPAYCTSKAAMDTYLEALRNRLAEDRVHVCTIKPGYVDTAMTQGMEKLFWLASPAEAAEKILAAARSRANVRYVKRRWWLVGTVIKSIPSFLFRHLNV
jgi:NAD(P)-dependent dehydrogenase (short-subunit alcohol dehydrogenase family)